MRIAVRKTSNLQTTGNLRLKNMSAGEAASLCKASLRKDPAALRKYKQWLDSYEAQKRSLWAVTMESIGK